MVWSNSAIIPYRTTSERVAQRHNFTDRAFFPELRSRVKQAVTFFAPGCPNDCNGELTKRRESRPILSPPRPLRKSETPTFRDVRLSSLAFPKGLPMAACSASDRVKRRGSHRVGRKEFLVCMPELSAVADDAKSRLFAPIVTTHHKYRRPRYSGTISSVDDVGRCWIYHRFFDNWQPAIPDRHPRGTGQILAINRHVKADDKGKIKTAR
jgi:hypothetical protein